jgi:hypothetical protein
MGRIEKTTNDVRFGFKYFFPVAAPVAVGPLK